MSAPASPVCGRAGARLSIFTASTGPRDVIGSPVNGEYSWDERPGLSFGAAGGMPRPASTTTSATASPMAATAADVPIMMFRQDHLMVTTFSRRRRYNFRSKGRGWRGREEPGTRGGRARVFQVVRGLHGLHQIAARSAPARALSPAGGEEGTERPASRAHRPPVCRPVRR